MKDELKSKVEEVIKELKLEYGVPEDPEEFDKFRTIINHLLWAISLNTIIDRDYYARGKYKEDFVRRFPGSESEGLVYLKKIEDTYARYEREGRLPHQLRKRYKQ